MGSEARICSLKFQIDGCCPFLSRRTDLCNTASCVLFLFNSLGIHEQGTASSPKLTFSSVHSEHQPMRNGGGFSEVGVLQVATPTSADGQLPRSSA